MKSYLILFAFCVLSGTTFAQSDEQNIDDQMDIALDQLEGLFDSLDLQHFFEVEFPKKIQEMAPNPAELQNIEGMIQESLSTLRQLDFSELQGLMFQLESQMGEIFKGVPSMPQAPKKPSDSDKKTKKI